MEQQILRLIDKLDSKEDYILIFLLKEKIQEENSLYNRINSLSNDELSIAKNKLRNELTNECRTVVENNHRYIKLKKIVSSRDCDDCKFAIIQTFKDRWGDEFSVYNLNEENNICKLCVDRSENLNKHINLIESNMEDSIFRVLNENEDFIKLKALIHKINSKVWYMKRDGVLTNK